MVHITVPNEPGLRMRWIKYVRAWPVGKKPWMEDASWRAGNAPSSYWVDVGPGTVLCWNMEAVTLRVVGWRWGAVAMDGTFSVVKSQTEARRLFRRFGEISPAPQPSQAPSGARQVVEIPTEVMEHVQKLTEANAGMVSEIVRVRSALVGEGHAHDCNLVTGTDEGVCNCPAASGAGLMSPEQMAGRYGRLLVRVEQAATLEQQLRDLFSVPEGTPLLQFCVALVRDIRNMNRSLQEAVATHTRKATDGQN